MQHECKIIERIDIPENDEEREWLAKQNFRNTAEDSNNKEVKDGRRHKKNRDRYHHPNISEIKWEVGTKILKSGN